VTGPQHYEEAERLLALIANDTDGSPRDISWVSDTIALAHVHAELATAAACGVPGPTGATAWRRVACEEQ
jgi:hypothetical protein